MGLHWDICLIYLDDVIIVGKTFEDMVKNLETVVQRIETARLKLKAQKGKLFARKAEFLEHVISEVGVRADPKKTDCVKN